MLSTYSTVKICCQQSTLHQSSSQLSIVLLVPQFEAVNFYARANTCNCLSAYQVSSVLYVVLLQSYLCWIISCLEIWVMGHSRSLEMATFNKLHTSSCWCSIATMAESCIISKTKRDHIGQKSQFFSHCNCIWHRHCGGPRWNVAITFDTEKLERWVYLAVENIYGYVYTHFDTIYTCDRHQTGWRTDTIRWHLWRHRATKTEHKVTQLINTLCVKPQDKNWTQSNTTDKHVMCQDKNWTQSNTTDKHVMCETSRQKLNTK